MRIVFMGTPDFAVPVLEHLADAGHEVSLAVSQPDRARGRGKTVAETPVARCARERGIPVYQPVRVRLPEALERIRQEAPDVIVVAAYGQILPQELLDIPAYGCVNVHASLLPAYRGAAPIQWAVLNGDEVSGVTIMQLNAGLDTGDILLQERFALRPRETSDSLYEALSQLGGEMIVRALELMERGELTPVPQDDAAATLAPRLTKDMGRIDWSKGPDELVHLVRGMCSWPGAATAFGGRGLRIWDAEPAEIPGADAAPGTVLAADRELVVACGGGALRILELQAEGKKRMPAADFLRGTRIPEGTVLGG